MATKQRTLLDISDDMLALADLLEEVGGEITEEKAEEAISLWFRELGKERDKKLDGYAALITELERREDVRKLEAKRLTARAKVDGNAAQRLRGRLYEFFKAQGISQLVTDRFNLGIVNNGGVCPLEYLLPAEKVPSEFQKVTIGYDNDAIRKALDAGEDLGFARYGERGDRLSI